MSGMAEDWRTLTGFGAKAVGTEGNRRARAYILGHMGALYAQAHLDEFTFEGWRATGDCRVRVQGSEGWTMDACMFLGSAGGAFSGVARPIGLNHVWNIYGWRRYALMQGGRVTAYITARSDGETLSQTLVEGNGDLPHLIIGARDEGRLRALLDRGMAPVLEGEARCRAEKGMKGANVVVPGGGYGDGRPGIILTAHYDTMYNTPGAYDNQAGVAVLMELGRRLVREGVERKVTLVFTDGEECRLAGSRHYAARIDPASVDFVLNIDGIGRGDELEIWCGPERFERKVMALLLDQPGVERQCYRNPPPPGSDHTPFYERGVDSCMLTFNDQGILHTPLDICNQRILPNMHKMVDLAMRMIRQA